MRHYWRGKLGGSFWFSDSRSPCLAPLLPGVSRKMEQPREGKQPAVSMR